MFIDGGLSKGKVKGKVKVKVKGKAKANIWWWCRFSCRKWGYVGMVVSAFAEVCVGCKLGVNAPKWNGFWKVRRVSLCCESRWADLKRGVWICIFECGYR